MRSKHSPPQQPDLPDTPRWRKFLAAAVAVVAVLLVVGFRDRLSADFWPLDRSFVGPNLLASIIQATALLLVLALVWPPTRRWIFHQFHSLHQKIDHHHDARKLEAERQHEHNEWVAKHVAETYRQTTGEDPDPHPHFKL